MARRSCRTWLLSCASLTALALTIQPWAPPVAESATRWAASQSAVRDDPGVKRASIRGVVTSGDSGEPLAAVHVAASLDSQIKAAAATNEDGQYEIRDLPPGRYIVTFEKAGFVPARYGQAYPGDRALRISLRHGQRREGIHAVLWPAGGIEGSVHDEKGAPIAGALVSASQVRLARGDRQLVPIWSAVRTDERGEYRLSGLQAGEYFVSASSELKPTLTSPDRPPSLPANVSGYAAMFYPGVPDVSDALAVTLGPGAVVPGVDIVVRKVRLARISGRLVTSSGKLFDGAHAALVAAPAAGLGTPGQRFIGIGHAASDGSFTIEGVPPGAYVLKAQSIPTAVVERVAQTGNPSHLLTFPDAEFAAMPLIVTGEDVSGLLLATSKGGRIQGRVLVGTQRLDPAARHSILVSAEPTAAHAMAAGATEAPLDDDGGFEIRGVAGPFVVRLTRVPYGFTLQRVDAGGRDVTDTGLDVQPGDVSSVEVVLSSSPTELSGKVTGLEDDDGGSAVIVFAEDSERWRWPSTRYLATGRVRSDGSFTVRGLPPATYLVIAVTAGDEERLLDPLSLAFLSRQASRVKLQEGERRTIRLRVH